MSIPLVCIDLIEGRITRYVNIASGRVRATHRLRFDEWTSGASGQYIDRAALEDFRVAPEGYVGPDAA